MADPKLETIPDALRAAIPAGLRPELVHGLALWLQGYSTLAAAKQAGCPQPTLWEHTQRLPEAIRGSRATYANAAEDIAYDLVLEAGRRTRERMQDDDKLSTMQLATIYGIASDKLVNLGRLRQNAERPTEGIGGLLGQLMDRGGGTVTLSVEHSAIDVTPKDADE